MTIQAEKTKKGLKWSILDQILRQIITLVISSILSRLLTPAEYGLLGLVMVATGFFQVIKDMGFGSSIIHKRNISNEEQSCLFWFNVLLGGTISLILFLSAPLIATFFKEPSLNVIVKVMSLNFIFTSIAIVPDAIIQKAMDFKGYFYRNLWATVISGVFGVWLAYHGYGVWALVGQTILASLIGLIVSFRIINWMPSWDFSWRLLRPHFKYSLPVLADNSVNYWVRNIDKILLGRILGAASVGIYNRAYALMLLPVSQISQTVNRVMFPSFALIQSDIEKMWNQYSKIIALIVLICFPIMGAMGIFAREVIVIVYGDGWMEAVPIFAVLSFLGAFQCIATMAGSVYYSTGKTVLMFKVGMVSRLLMVLGIVLGIYYNGLMGMVWGYFSTSMIAFFVELYFVCKLLNHSIFSLVKNSLPEIIASTTFICVLFAGKIGYSELGDSFVKFLVVHMGILIVALLLYFYLLNKLRSESFNFLKRIIHEKWSKNSSSDVR